MADNQRRSSDRIRSRPIRRISSKTLTTPKNSDASEHQEPPRKQSRIPEKTGTHLESRSQTSKIAESGLHPSQIFTPYQYEPLHEVAQEIRLLKILPGSFSSEIRVCLDIKSFATEDSEWETDSDLESGEDSDPDYEADLDLTFEALSYTWGSPLEAVDILIGESGSRTVKVTQNLAEALPHLRYSDKSRTIWIDAICVNQQDLEERSSQVKRMANIYSKASQVVVWLGPEREDSQLAMDFCKEVPANTVVAWDMQSIALPPGCEEEHWAVENEPYTGHWMKRSQYVIG